MTTYVALLRGINLGGHNKIPMAQLRQALEAAGYENVRTYIQSGNVLLEAPKAKPASIAVGVHQVIQDEFGLDIATIALDVPTLAKVVKNNPFADQDDPRRVHVFFLAGTLSDDELALVRELERSARAKGSRDEIAVVGAAMYLHTPDGFGTSDLAKTLSTRSKAAHRSGTARNWATVKKLVDLTEP